jgi:Fe-S cluster biosynthesis and repair protein YggX
MTSPAQRLLAKDRKFIEALKRVAVAIADSTPGEYLIDDREPYYPSIEGKYIWRRIDGDVGSKWLAANTMPETFRELSILSEDHMIDEVEEFLKNFEVDGHDPAVERIYNEARSFYLENDLDGGRRHRWASQHEGDFEGRLARRVASAYLRR